MIENTNKLETALEDKATGNRKPPLWGEVWKGLLKLVLAMMPFILFGLIYDSMRYYPNYLFGDIDIQGIYETEKAWFGIGDGAARLTPNEWFTLHAKPALDLLAGIFYLCWVPLPVAFGFYLFFSGRRQQAFRFTAALLFVNLIGFIDEFNKRHSGAFLSGDSFNTSH